MRATFSAIARISLTCVALASSTTVRADDPLILTLQPTGREPAETPLLMQVPDTLATGTVTSAAARGRADLRREHLRRRADCVPGRRARQDAEKEKAGPVPALRTDSLPRRRPHRAAGDEGRAAGRESRRPRSSRRSRRTALHLSPDRPHRQNRTPAPLPDEECRGEDHDHPHPTLLLVHLRRVAMASISGPNSPATARSRPFAIASSPMARLTQVFVSTNEWKSPDGKTLLTDDRRIIFCEHRGDSRHRFRRDGPRLTRSPSTFGDTKEGMFGLRVASTMDVKRKLGGKITQRRRDYRQRRRLGQGLSVGRLHRPRRRKDRRDRHSQQADPASAIPPLGTSATTGSSRPIHSAITTLARRKAANIRCRWASRSICLSPDPPRRNDRRG